MNSYLGSILSLMPWKAHLSADFAHHFFTLILGNDWYGVCMDRDSIECLNSFTKACVPKWAENKKELYQEIDNGE